jgi:hypothetical protein
MCRAARQVLTRAVRCARRWRWRVHAAVWVDVRDLLAEGILISSHMMVDHFPDVVAAVLERTVAERAAAKRVARAAPG